MRVALLRRAAALLDGAVEQALRIRLAFVGQLLRAVEQHHVDAGLGRHVGDAAAHHAGAEDAHLLHFAGRHVFRARGALLDGVELVPQRVDEVLALLAHHAGGKVAALHHARGVEVEQAALEHAAHDVLHGGVVAVALGAGDAGRDRKDLLGAFAAAVAARPLELGVVPRLLRLGVGRDPGLGLGHQVGLVGGGVGQQAHLLGLGGRQVVALGAQLQALLDAQQPRQALRAAATGQQAELDLGLADLEPRVVDGDARVARERDLQPAAERVAVDGGHHRLALQLHLAQHGLHRHRAVERLLGPRPLAHVVEVAAGAEVGLAAGEDEAFHRGVGELLHRGLDAGHQAHRPPRSSGGRARPSWRRGCRRLPRVRFTALL